MDQRKGDVASEKECELALQGLAAKLSEKDPAQRKTGFDRSLSCTLRDLKITFAGQLRDGELTGITRVAKPTAQIRLDMTSDDLLSLVDGKLNMASAWATGRVKVQAGVMDMIKLRSIF
jgi:hypothetical protein